MNIIDIENKDSLQNAAAVLKNGGVLIFPTDTVYGIGCLMIDKAIDKLYEIKNRPKTQPTAVLMNRNIFDGKRTKALEFNFDLENNFYAGVLTIIDNIDNYAIKFPETIIENQTIGVRLPHHVWLEELIDKVGPIVATSANRKGERPPTKFSEISEELKKEVDLVVESREAMSGKPSEIIVLETKEKLR